MCLFLARPVEWNSIQKQTIVISNYYDLILLIVVVSINIVVVIIKNYWAKIIQAKAILLKKNWEQDLC